MNTMMYKINLVYIINVYLIEKAVMTRVYPLSLLPFQKASRPLQRLSVQKPLSLKALIHIMVVCIDCEVKYTWLH